ncbi:CHASE domain-containing protein [Aliikangiella sp. IMCC44359]|uniref:CHASE domain-containing protein n=1 Tax=Aliikangiella sp. IMCC44359 TaxID=3459125 RepID=UPI00403ADD26
MDKTQSTLSHLPGYVLILGLCIIYAIVGRLALLLAIPPGYATAIFPSAGLAVAALIIWGYRLWLGVFLGSILLNLWVSVEQGVIGESQIWVAITAASGASLQAFVAAVLVKNILGRAIALVKEQEIALFLLIAGPLACLINASFGSTSLLLNGIITTSQYSFSWFTWWVGDTIGVLIATPIMFILFSKPRNLWWARRYSVAFPLLSMLSIVIVLFFWVNKLEYEQMQFDFKNLAKDTSDKIKEQFHSYLESVEAIERFFVSSTNVDREEFHTFVATSIVKKTGIQALGWNPIILKMQRDSFEASVRQEGFHDFQIMQRDKNGKLIPAKERDRYVVVTYIEPMKGNEKAFGFDVASDIARKQALTKAIDTNQALATAGITLVQDNSKKIGFLLFYPVFKGASSTLEERRNNIYGFAVGVFRVGDIVEQILDTNKRESFNLSIIDKDAPAEKNLLYGNKKELNNSLIDWGDTLFIGGREWILHFEPTKEYLVKHNGWKAWVILAVGLLFTSLLGAFLLAMTGRSHQVEKLVTRRTAELSGILSSVLETIITIDEKGFIESINAAGEVLFGYKADEIIGQPITQIIPQFFYESKIDVDDFVYESLIDSRRDLVIINKNKSEIPIEIAVSKLLTMEKTLYTIVIHNLTERTKINRMKDEFISTVSHELRTPLTSIKGSLGLVVGGAFNGDDKKIQDVLKISYENSERLESLINELLDINKIHSTDMSIKMLPINVKELMDKALLSNQGFADKYNVFLQLNVSINNDIKVMGDESRLMQVLANLFSNAIKYSDKGSMVNITLEQVDDEVKFSIQDKGVGIPMEFQQRVFEKFTQADSSDTRRVGGTGLGLAITKSIIEKHNGRIDFISHPGKGTEFYFYLKIIK